MNWKASNELVVAKAITASDKQAISRIRTTVFVLEQNVPSDQEYDEFEETSTHFIAWINGEPIGTARWRGTDRGIKLERFAVLKDWRGRGVGQALVKAVLDDVILQSDSFGTLLYLHAQLPAIPFYAKFGFEKEGAMFMECDIAHYLMSKYL